MIMIRYETSGLCDWDFLMELRYGQSSHMHHFHNYGLLLCQNIKQNFILQEMRISN